MTLPRSVRNSNPGNIRADTDDYWKGQTGRDADGFATFENLAYGVRAMWAIFRTYRFEHKIYDLEGTIRRWSTTDQDSYLRYVRNVMGPTTLIWPLAYAILIEAISDFESGGWKVSRAFAEKVYNEYKEDLK
jgi:hypothetical protein